MSKTVDERVVSMQFDNKKFESNVQTTMSTLDKLKQKLNLKDSAKGLENIDAASRKIDFSPLGNGIETVKAKFSALDVMAVTALANITNQAVEAGKRLVAAFTVDPIKTGFQEYELKMGSVQTIMASTGASLEEVNGYLAELNEYSDKTIYSFSDMTNNIGKFTNAGVKLEDAVLAIKGISNEAAVSGANANEASRAMYNFSQALSAGYVKLIDWKSIENANMATVEFKDQLLETAVAIGTLTKSSEGYYTTLEGNQLTATQNFNDSLQDQWMTTEVLTKTLAKYADETTDIGKKAYASAQDVKTFTMMMDTLKEAAQSGWAETWELIVGDFEQAKGMWTTVSKTIGNIISNSSKKRNATIREALFGQDASWDTLIEKLNAAGVSTEAFENKLKESLKNAGIPIDTLIEKYGSLKEAIRHVTDAGKYIKETILSFANGEKVASGETKDLTDKLEYFNDIVGKVINGDFGNGEERVKKMAEAGYEYAKVQKLVNEIWERNGHTWDDCTLSAEELTKWIGEMSVEEIKNAGYTEEQAKALKELAQQAAETGTPLDELIEKMQKPTGRELLFESAANVFNTFKNILGGIKKAWDETFQIDKAAVLYKIIEAIHSLTEYLYVNENEAKQITRIFKGLFAILDLIRMVVGGGLKIAFKLFSAVLEAFDLDILEVTAKIGDAIVKFRDWIKENDYLTKGIKKVAGFIKDTAVAIYDWAKNCEFLNDAYKNVKDFVLDSINSFKEFVEGAKEAENVPKYIIEGLVKGFGKGISAVAKAALSLGKTILETICEFLGIQSPSKKFIEVGQYIIQGLIKGIQNGASTVFEAIKNVGIGIIDVVKKIDFGKVFAALLGVGMFVFAKKLIGILENITAPLTSFSGLMDSLGESASYLSKSMGKAMKLKAIGSLLLNIGISIALLAASLFVISKIPEDKIWGCVGVITALAAVMIVLAGASALMSKFGGSGTSALSMVGIMLSLLILVGVIKQIVGVSPEDLKKGYDTIASMIGLIAMIMLISKIPGDGIKGAGKTLIAFALTLYLMVGLMKTIAKMDPKDIFKGLIVVGALELLIIGLIAATKLGGKDLDKAGSMILKSAAAIGLMALAIKLIATISPSDITKGLITLAGMVGIIALLNLVSRLAGKSKTRSKSNDPGKTILGMAASLVLMAVAIKILAGMSTDDLKKGLVALTILSVLITGLIAVSKLAGKNAAKAGIMLIAVATSLIILTGVLFILSKMEGDGLWRAVGIVAILEAMFGGLIAVTKLAKKCMSTLIVLTAVVTILSGILIGLTFIDPNRLAVATASLSAVIGMFALLVGITKYSKVTKEMRKTLLTMTLVVVALAGVLALLTLMDNPASMLGSAAALSLLLLSLSGSIALLGNVSRISKSALKALGIMTAVTAGLALILGIMSALNVTASMQSALALGVLLNAMAAALLILDKVKKVSLKAVGAMALMGLVVAELAVVLGVMDKFNVQPSIESAVALGILLNAMSAALLILSFIGTFGAGAFIGIGALATLIVAIGGLLIAIGALVDNVPEAERFLNKGIPVLEKIGTALGSFFGNIVGGFLKGMSDSLPAIGLNLSLFMVNIGAFVAGAKTIDDKALNGVENIAKMIALITAADIISGIGSFITGDSSLDSFGAKLVSFGNYMIEFSNVLKNGSIDSEAVEAAGNAGMMMAKVAEAIPNSGGVAGFFAGENDIDDFGAKLVSFAEYMIAFNNELSKTTFDQTKIVAASMAVGLFAKVSEAIPNSGGVAGFFAGENDIDDFGRKLSKFAGYMVGFNEKLSETTFDQTKIVAAATLVSLFAKVSEAIPNSGGVAAFFAGDNDIDDFGKKLSSFAGYMVKFNNKISETTFDQSKIIAAGFVVSMFAKIAEAIPNSGGVAAFFAGDNDIDDFGKKLSSFAGYMVKFNNKISETTFDMTKVAAVKCIGAMMLELQNSLPKTGGLFQLFSGKQDISTFGDNLSDFGSAFADFYDSIADVNSYKLLMACNCIEKIIDIAKQTNGLDTSGMTGFAEAIAEMAEAGIDEFVTTFNRSEAKAQKAIKSFVTAVESSAKKRKTAVINAFKGMAKDAAEAIKSVESTNGKFSSAGRYLVDGFADGIDSNTFKAEASAAAMARSAYNAAMKALKAHSPSRLFKEVGSYVPMGFAIGIDKFSGLVEDSSTDMATSAINSAKNVVNNMGKVITTGYNLSPTVSPVVDMSNLRAKNVQLGASLDASLTTPVNSLSRMVAEAQARIDESNGKVTSAINSLREELSGYYENNDTEISLYVDSKKLASSLAKPMDRQLNILSKRGAY